MPATPAFGGLACRAYFNGVHLSGLLSLKTMAVKLFSAIFVLAAGLVAEGESPFVHVGAIVGGGLSSLGSRWAQLPGAFRDLCDISCLDRLCKVRHCTVNRRATLHRSVTRATKGRWQAKVPRWAGGWFRSEVVRLADR